MAAWQGLSPREADDTPKGLVERQLGEKAATNTALVGVTPGMTAAGIVTADGAISKPLLLVGVDGVLNCFGDQGSGGVSFEAEFVVDGHYQIKVPAGAREGLSRLSEVLVCVWASPWQADTHLKMGARLEIETPWPYIIFDDDPLGPYPTAKLRAVARYAADRPVAWLDGDLRDDARRWAVGRQRDGIATLLLQPEVNLGLTAGHVERLQEWAADLAQCEQPVVEIASKAPHPARALSNFTAHRFTFRGLPVSSMEGLLQSLKCAEPKRQREIMRLAGKEAKKAGAGLTWRACQRLFWQGEALDRHGPAYQQLLDEAFSSLFAQNRRARAALLETGDSPLAHNLGSRDPRATVLTIEEFISRLARERIGLRRPATSR